MHWRILRMSLAVLGLVALSILGFWGVHVEWPWAQTFGSKLSTGLQIADSVLGLLAALALLLRPRWARVLLYAWALALVMTGGTASVLWEKQGWKATLVAVAIALVCAAVVMALVPLAPADAGVKRWRKVAIVLSVLAAGLMLYLALGYAPLVVRGVAMERFCEGLRKDMNRDELKSAVHAQGYRSSERTDRHGPFLRIDDDGAGGHYHCEVRFKSDGSIDYFYFTAKAAD